MTSLKSKVLNSVAAYTVLLLISAPSVRGCNAKESQAEKTPNIILILVDDQRYDFLSYLNHPWIETPQIDKLASNSLYFENAFVTTSLCSPSRASILTGMYAHAHTVIDNDTPLPSELPTFPSILQKAGYKTALIGKWHMGGESSEPRPGFDYWLSFPGQGKYVNPDLNLNGKTFNKEGYTTDILTDYAVEFISNNVKSKTPYCLYLAHKAVHENFTPAQRHIGYYKDLIIPRPGTFENTENNRAGKPDWVVKQRQSWHGTERDNLGGFDNFFRRYSECMLSVDESVGRVVKTLKDLGELENTVIIYLSDNGYLMGEHGLIDKRVMYEAAIRVPLFIHYPKLIKEPKKIEEFALNIDIAPTILELTNQDIPESMHGKSLLPLIKNINTEWRKDFLYEYFQDYNAVQTPTIFGLRTKDYSYITTQGLWDNYELYDLRTDKEQVNNLLQNINYGQRYGGFVVNVRRQDIGLSEIILPMEKRIKEILDETNGRRNPGWKAF